MTAATAKEIVRLTGAKLAVEIAVDTRHLEREYGPRFDSTAVVVSARLADNEFLDPRGLCDEFGLHGLGVLGYTDASPDGGEFLKIGAAVLRRDQAGEYCFAHHWPVARSMDVEITVGFAELTVVQRSPLCHDYAYELQKTYRLEAGETMTIDYALSNRGTKSFAFDHYNHNFFSFGGVAADEKYRVEPAFSIPSAGNRHWAANFGALRLVEAAPAKRGVHFGTDLTPPARPNRVVLGHDAGPRVEIGGDFPVARFVMWAAGPAICPEIFFRSPELLADATVRWSRYYRFYIAP